jgi:outer membrane protein assembly factor BamB
MFKFLRTLPMLLTLGTTLFAADWKTWLGPNRDGKSPETGLLKSWPEAGPKVAWRTAGLGEGYSTMAVVGDRIYTQGQDQNGQFVVSLDATNGKQVWKTPMGGVYRSGQGSGPRGMPQIDGNRLYALGSDGSLVCLETGTGKKVWGLSYIEKFHSTNPQWGFSESPLVDGDRLVINPGGAGAGIVALNKATGDVIWKAQDDLANYSSVLPIDFGGLHIYTVVTASGAVAVDGKDGSLLWRYPKVNGNRINVATPVYADGYVFYSAGYGTGGGLMKLSAEGGKVTATEVYFTREMQNHYTTSVKVGDHLYGFSGNSSPTSLVAMEFMTGKVAWERNSSAERGNCILADGLLYCQGESGRFALIDPSPSGYKEISQIDFHRNNAPMTWVPNGNMWAYPTIANGKLYVRDQDLLIAFDIKR